MANTEHLDALRLRLSNERLRLAAAKTDAEIQFRAVWLAQIEKEIEAEVIFLKIERTSLPDLTDEELLSELGFPQASGD